MTESYNIYGLTDHLGRVRYVGVTFQNPPEKRFSDHMCCSLHKPGYLGNWIRKMKRLGHEIGFVILEHGTEGWSDREKFWIASFADLVNTTTGGERPVFHGPNGSLSRARMSESGKRRFASPESRLELSEHVKAGQSHPSVRARMLEHLSRINSDPNVKSKIIASKKASPRTYEVVAALAADPLVQKKKSESAKNSPKVKAQLAGLHNDPVHRENHRARMSELVRRPDVIAARKAACAAVESLPEMKEYRRAIMDLSNAKREFKKRFGYAPVLRKPGLETAARS